MPRRPRSDSLQSRLIDIERAATGRYPARPRELVPLPTGTLWARALQLYGQFSCHRVPEGWAPSDPARLAWPSMSWTLLGTRVVRVCRALRRRQETSAPAKHCRTAVAAAWAEMAASRRRSWCKPWFAKAGIASSGRLLLGCKHLGDSRWRLVARLEGAETLAPPADRHLISTALTPRCRTGRAPPVCQPGPSRLTASHREICLECRSTQMAVQDCFRRLKLDALVLALQQLAQGAGQNPHPTLCVLAVARGQRPCEGCHEPVSWQLFDAAARTTMRVSNLGCSRDTLDESPCLTRTSALAHALLVEAQDRRQQIA